MESQQPNKLTTICSLLITLTIMISLVYGAVSWGFKGEMPAAAHWTVLGLGGLLVLALLLACVSTFRRSSPASRRTQ